ncbi:NIL domain-containing protein [Chloroflexota bacterium]
MAKRRVILSFTPETIAEPIIYTISQQFNLAINVRQADLDEDKGWMTVEFDGIKEDIEAGITWAISKGVRVDPTSEEI